MFAALHLPDFKASAALRAAPESREHPCAVIPTGADPDDPKAKLQLLAVNHHARNLGLTAGWELNRALVRCPGLKVFFPQPDHEAALFRELIDLAESLTPDLEITSADTLILDISRAPKRKIAFLEEFEIPHAEIWQVRAPTPDLAHLAVLHEQSQGGLLDPSYFARLPIDLLATFPGVPDHLPMLRLWGLRALGDFMGLPRQDLVDRLGTVVGYAHDILHGKACRLLRLHRPPASLGQSYDFEDGVHLTEPLVFTAKRLLHTLSSRVAASYLAVATLEITLHLESRGTLERTIRLPEPLVDANELLRPIQTFLENLQLESPVTGIDLDATTTAPNPAQREWLGRQLPNPTRWADTLARVEALVGRGNVGIPAPENTHRPDAFRMLPPFTAFPSLPPDTPAAISCSLPLQRFRPPEVVAVASIIQRKLAIPMAILTGKHKGEITHRHGPFSLNGGSWDERKEWKSIEWDIELEGRLMRLGFTPPESWQLEGIYS